MKMHSCITSMMIILMFTGMIQLPKSCQEDRKLPERHSFVIGINPEKIEYYKRMHAHAWPEVLSVLRKCNIRNYSIHLGELEEGKVYLFAYFEYTGKNLEKDMKRMAESEVIQKWWKLTDPCQIPCSTRREGEFWMKLEEVFYTN